MISFSVFSLILFYVAIGFYGYMVANDKTLYLAFIKAYYWRICLEITILISLIVIGFCFINRK